MSLKVDAPQGSVDGGTVASKPSDYQVDGPRSCDKYYDACACAACARRDTWYLKEAI